MPSVSVKILLFATLRDKYHTKELVVNCNGSIKSLIESASEVLGKEFLRDIYDEELGKIREDITLMINGRNIKDLKGNIVLKDQDVVAIFPPLAGG
ncbi:MAG: MoaD/ThiS family protein [Candidatus Bathyarchaeia archaeon]